MGLFGVWCLVFGVWCLAFWKVEEAHSMDEQKNFSGRTEAGEGPTKSVTSITNLVGVGR